MTLSDRTEKAVIEESEGIPWRLEECPMSVILRFPDMNNLVTEIIHFGHIKSATGAVPFGPDSTNWPCKWVDAVRAAELESWSVDEACDRLRNFMRQN